MCRYKNVPKALEAQAIEKFVLRFPRSPVYLQKVCVRAAVRMSTKTLCMDIPHILHCKHAQPGPPDAAALPKFQPTPVLDTAETSEQQPGTPPVCFF